MTGEIVIVNYGMGNLHSVQKRMNRLNANSVVSSDRDVIYRASKIILPGVGHFGKAMQKLNELDLVGVLNEKVLVKKTPILGICLGMQLLAKKSEEGDSTGLGWIDGEIVKFKVSDHIKYKVPHTGWNEVKKSKESGLMKNLPEGSEFYFVHSYHFVNGKKEDILNETFYDYAFVSAIEKENIFGVQYHPEKSHDAGNQLLKNFIEI